MFVSKIDEGHAVKIDEGHGVWCEPMVPADLGQWRPAATDKNHWVVLDSHVRC
jgi:hypothetical protein